MGSKAATLFLNIFLSNDFKLKHPSLHFLRISRDLMLTPIQPRIIDNDSKITVKETPGNSTYNGIGIIEYI